MGWKFKPEVVKEGHYKGHVLVKFPQLAERQKLVKELNLNLDLDKGKLDFKNAVEQSHRLQELGRKHIESCDLTSIEDKEIVAKTVEDIEQNPELVGIFQEVGGLVLNGVQLPKKSKTDSEPSSEDSQKAD